MKRIFIILFIVTIVICGILFLKEKVYYNRLEKDFHIETKKMQLKKIYETEEWLPNGDGFKLMILSYKNFNKNITNLDKLPIKEDLPPNQIPIEYLNKTNGYYSYIIDCNDNRNFKIMIINISKKEIYVYYQIM